MPVGEAAVERALRERDRWIARTDPAAVAGWPEGGLMVRLRAVLEYAAAPVWWMPEPPDVRPGAPADAVPGET
ncbi:hypothetical protein, partial [Hydrogenibacillus schlegelii]|uniref:hypothetical protein n=1 Tax=Hydrogenibacillus schlegelii TaxID=1484 RepID=UPI00349FF989